jgi:hypothetical protein
MVESGARASKSPQGELRSRPLATLLAAACERGATGTFSFRLGERHDALTLRAGQIAVVRTSSSVSYLGGLLYELGAIDMTTLNETLREVATAKRLHGEVLRERGAIDRAHLDGALVEQTFRNVNHLFTLPEETRWAFHEGRDELTGARDEGRPPIPTWRAIWRGLRAQPAAAHIGRTLAKLEGAVHLQDLRSVERFGLGPEEMELCERLHAQPSTLPQLVATSPLAAERIQLLVYILALGRCIVRVERDPVGPIELGIRGVRERARRIDQEDPHVVLGLRADSSLEAERAAYFRLARLWHPDRIPRELDAVRADCEHVFSRLGAAHRILTDVGGQRGVEARIGAAKTAAANDSSLPAVRTNTIRDVDAALARGDLATAREVARALTSDGADGPGARAVVAWCSVEGGASADPAALEAALEALERVVTGDPECVRALYYRGQILKRLDRPEAAARDFKKVTRLQPRHVDAEREVRLFDIQRSRTR